MSRGIKTYTIKKKTIFALIFFYKTSSFQYLKTSQIAIIITLQLQIDFLEHLYNFFVNYYCLLNFYIWCRFCVWFWFWSERAAYTFGGLFGEWVLKFFSWWKNICLSATGKEASIVCLLKLILNFWRSSSFYQSLKDFILSNLGFGLNFIYFLLNYLLF